MLKLDPLWAQEVYQYNLTRLVLTGQSHLLDIKADLRDGLDMVLFEPALSIVIGQLAGAVKDRQTGVWVTVYPHCSLDVVTAITDDLPHAPKAWRRAFLGNKMEQSWVGSSRLFENQIPMHKNGAFFDKMFIGYS